MSSDDLVAALDSILLRYVNLPFGQAEGIECRDAILIALAAKPEPGLDAAFRRARRAMPDDWMGPWMEPWTPERSTWMAAAASERCWSDGGNDYEDEHTQGEGLLPEDALLDLAEKLAARLSDEGAEG